MPPEVEKGMQVGVGEGMPPEVGEGMQPGVGEGTWGMKPVLQFRSVY